MQIIKDNQITNDAWEYVPDDAELGDGDMTISLSRLQQEGKEILNRTGKLGVRIVPSDSIEEIADFLPDLALVDLYFSEPNDGRLFSHAWLLRNRHHYTDEIRATGHFLPDQVFYLSRVGVNSFCPESADYLSATLAGLKDFSVNYQPSVN
ncbi:MAG: DUF934 domain-containing protein [Methyloglobulus sp.]|nr:DUF934 domain-containing protein [Methyloglobulus sp.]